MNKSFKALVVREENSGSFNRKVEDVEIADLPDNDVLIRVHYSSLNYKDALSASGHRGVTKQYPHIPGIDAAGVIEESNDNRFQEGDQVIVTSYDLGQNTYGGFGQYIRVPGDWIVPLPKQLSLKESMIFGTAGLTAAIGVHHLQHNNINTDSGPILVTGATGGVGSLAVSILSGLGYQVVAATGKTDHKEYLNNIGAHSVIHRKEVQDETSKPLLSSRWSGAIETVGGIMLDNAIRQAQHNGTVACCGNVLGHKLHTNVYPFILRGVTLAGIDSGNCLMEMRKKIWQHLATDWKPENLDFLARECALNNLNKEIDQILSGKQVGRVLINLKNND